MLLLKHIASSFGIDELSYTMGEADYYHRLDSDSTADSGRRQEKINGSGGSYQRQV